MNRRSRIQVQWALSTRQGNTAFTCEILLPLKISTIIPPTFLLHTSELVTRFRELNRKHEKSTFIVNQPQQLHSDFERFSYSFDDKNMILFRKENVYSLRFCAWYQIFKRCPISGNDGRLTACSCQHSTISV